MRVIAWKTLRVFSDRHRAARAPLRAWYTLTRHAVWKTPADVRKTFNTADFVGTRAVFDIKGNQYRLIAEIDYQRELVFIIWVGNHADYDKVNVRTVQYDPRR
ncbi:MAG: type II toxin-antitoxin system HigB family toxin [Proteobacteria bacterium]|nr:type II toxin-antitoxin system HigB family toxin [Pseudomonadota bacterium]